MLYINPDNNKIDNAKSEFHKEMYPIILDRIKKIRDKGIKGKFNNIICNRIDDILIGKPEQLIELHNCISPMIKRNWKFKSDINRVFNYTSFSKKASRYNTYHLADALSINTCPYCNRNYTSTVIDENGKKIIRPQFDHYFPQTKFPLLAVSFYNLIPCCSICNSDIKGVKEFKLSTHLHPYVDNCKDDISFTYSYSMDNKSRLKIKLKAKNIKAQNTIQDFALEEIYNAHVSELEDLIKTKNYYSDKYLNILSSNILKDVPISLEELYRLAFGVEYDTQNYINRPFSKF